MAFPTGQTGKLYRGMWLESSHFQFSSLGGGSSLFSCTRNSVLLWFTFLAVGVKGGESTLPGDAT